MLLPLFSERPPLPTPAWSASDGTWIGLLKVLAAEHPDVGVPWGLIGGDPPHALMTPVDVKTETDRTSNPIEVGDAIWRYIVAQVRSQRGPWHLYAIAAAENKLRQAALWYASTNAAVEDVWRAHTDIVGEFLRVLHHKKLDLAEPGLARRIVNDAHYYVRTRCHTPEKLTLLRDDGADSDLDYLATRYRPYRPAGHVDLTLAQLILDTAPVLKQNRKPKPRRPGVPVTPPRRRRPARGSDFESSPGAVMAGGRLRGKDASLVARALFERTKNDHHKTIKAAARELGLNPAAAPMRYHRATKLITRLLPPLHTNTRRPRAGTAAPPRQPAADPPAPDSPPADPATADTPPDGPGEP